MSYLSARGLFACARLSATCTHSSQCIKARLTPRFAGSTTFQKHQLRRGRVASPPLVGAGQGARSLCACNSSASRLSLRQRSRQHMATTATAVSDPPATETSNPLLQETTLPAFDKIKAEHVVPGIKQLLAELNANLDDLESKVQPTWEGLVVPLERLSDRIERNWGAVTHLKAVKDSEPLRTAVDEVQPERVKLSLRLSQSKPLYDAFKGIKEGKLWSQLSEAQQRIVDSELRDFVLGGVALEGSAKERFNEIQQELSQLSTKFSNNLLDATKAFKKLLKDPAEIEGLPKSALELAAQQAKAEGEEDATPEKGPWLFTLDFPSFFPVITHSKNRALREEMYRANITRASSGEQDNSPLIEKVLTLKQEKAKLLGYANFAEVSMASKMATLDKAEALLEDLRSASWDAAVKDLDDIKDFAAKQGFSEDLRQWDVSFWAERLREAKFNITDEELRPYFALPNVLKGLFQVAGHLFGVTVEAADGQAPVWNPDVRFFCIKQESKPVAYFYFDPYSRPAEKRGGAWMDEVVGRSSLLAAQGQDVRLPVAHMVCNQTPPVGDKPSLMTFRSSSSSRMAQSHCSGPPTTRVLQTCNFNDAGHIFEQLTRDHPTYVRAWVGPHGLQSNSSREVETVFHEFGHALQHMMTKQQEGLVAGIRGVEWDAVELPSQFMENWCYNRATLNTFARHYETDAPLPEDLFKKLVAARTFRSGTMMMRQLHFAMLDLELHARYQPGGKETVFDVDHRIAEQTMVMKPLPEDRFLCGFSHIFAGGYSAGYYSYKWAEVLSADAFSAFEEAGLEDESALAEVGKRFRDTVLSLGGGRAPALVFKDFRGRDPSTEALLRHNDLLPAAA